jgi:hypothetical protein
MPRSSDVARRVGVYLAHLSVAWPLTFALGLALASTSAVGGALFDVPNSSPVFAGWLALGAALGFGLNRRHASLAACFVFLPPFVLFLHEASITMGMPFGGGWAGVWTAFFSRNCASSECLNELLVTAPLLSSVSYSVAAFAARRSRPPGTVPAIR